MRTARLTALAAVTALSLFGAAAALAASSAVSPDFPNAVSGAGLQAFSLKPQGHPQHVTLEAPEKWSGWGQVSPIVQENVRKAIGTLQAPLSANVQASNPAGDATGETQSECAITAFSNKVVVAWNDSRGFTAGFTLSSYAYSCDFGATFTDGGNVPLALAGDQAFGDCVLDYDASGNVYLSSIYTRTGVQGIAVWKGSFGSSGCTFTWNTPVLAHTGTADDKNWHACDRNQTGVIYVTFTNFALSPLPIQEVHSSNGGATWSAAQTLSVGSTSVQGSQVVVDPAGNVHVCWQDGGNSIACDRSSETPQNIKYAKSINSGVSYSAPAILSATQPSWQGWGPGNIRATSNSFPSLNVDRSGGVNNGELFVTWAEGCTWPAPTGTGVSTAENTATTPGDSNGTPNASGVKTLAIGDAGTGTIATSSDIDFWKMNLTAGQHLVLYLEPQGFNCGVTGTTRNFRIRLYANPINTAATPDTILGNSNVGSFQSRIAFDVQRTGTYFIRVQNLNGSGTTTGTYTLLTRNVVPNAPSAGAPARDFRDIVECHSTNGGTTWSTKQLVNNDAPVGYEETLPFTCVDGSGVAYIFWFDRRESDTTPRTSLLGQWTDLYMSKSSDGGVTWAGGQRISDESSIYNLNTIAIPNMGDYNTAVSAGCNTYATWSDERKSHSATSGVDCFVDRFNACITPVAISDFEASAGQGYVDVAFTASVEGFAKFQLFRSDNRASGYQPIGDEMDGIGQKSYTFRDNTAKGGADYYYKVGYQTGGAWTYSSPIQVHTRVSQLALRAAVPNPTRGLARLDYEIARAGKATLEIYNLAGQRVRTLLSGSVAPGTGSAIWDGRSENGSSLPTGAYFARLTSEGRALTQRVMLIH